MNKLVGAWQLTAYQADRADGDLFYPMGKDVTGYIMYTHDGFMSANLMRPGRAPFKGDFSTATPEERAAAAEGYFGYAAQYEFDEAAGIVLHHVKISLVPNWIGTTQQRLTIFNGDDLELRAPAATIVRGESRVLRIFWRRLKR